ncbi:uncharacterized protein LOC144253676 [Urocitellus parryii]
MFLLFHPHPWVNFPRRAAHHPLSTPASFLSPEVSSALCRSSSSLYVSGPRKNSRHAGPGPGVYTADLAPPCVRRELRTTGSRLTQVQGEYSFTYLEMLDDGDSTIPVYGFEL